MAIHSLCGGGQLCGHSDSIGLCVVVHQLRTGVCVCLYNECGIITRRCMPPRCKHTSSHPQHPHAYNFASNSASRHALWGALDLVVNAGQIATSHIHTQILQQRNPSVCVCVCVCVVMYNGCYVLIALHTTKVPGLYPIPTAPPCILYLILPMCTHSMEL